MTENQEKPFFIKDFPADLKKEAQHYAIDAGTNLKALIMKALRYYMDNKGL
jgi:hypothetical protein